MSIHFLDGIDEAEVQTVQPKDNFWNGRGPAIIIAAVAAAIFATSFMATAGLSIGTSILAGALIVPVSGLGGAVIVGSLTGLFQGETDWQNITLVAAAIVGIVIGSIFSGGSAVVLGGLLGSGITGLGIVLTLECCVIKRS